MNEQPEALRLADAMQHYFDGRGPDAEAVAAELRRLHEANEAFGKRQKWWNDRMFEMEAALRQAVEALNLYLKMDTMEESYLLEIDIAPKAITAAKKALGEA